MMPTSARPGPSACPCCSARRTPCCKPSSGRASSSPSRCWGSTRTTAASSSTSCFSTAVSGRRSPSRGRTANKNDQCYVEQKNGLVVRHLVGYDRFEGEQAYRQLAEL